MTYRPNLVPHDAKGVPEYLNRELLQVSDAVQTLSDVVTQIPPDLTSRVEALENALNALTPRVDTLEQFNNFYRTVVSRQIAFAQRVTAPQTVTATVQTPAVITFESVPIDNDSIAANNRFTAEVPGVHLLSAWLELFNTSVGGGVLLRKNATELDAWNWNPLAGVINPVFIRLENLAVDDYIDLAGFGNFQVNRMGLTIIKQGDATHPPGYPGT